MKKLLIRMPGNVHVKLKLIAAAQNTSLQALVNDVLSHYIHRHSGDVAKVMEENQPYN